jgi:3-oxocholest-4-en-26-oate---CoA ligase
MELHLATVWESVADVVPEQTAIVQGERRVSWADLDARAASLAGAFASAGLRPGSKVAQYLYNSPEYLESYFAALKIRAIPVNVNFRYLDDELLYLLDNSQAEVVLYNSSLADRVERVRPRATGVKLFVEVDDAGPGGVQGSVAYEDLIKTSAPAARIARDPDDITMLYTGGTTGMPKGVMTRVGGAVSTHMATLPPMVSLAPVTDPADVAPMARRLADEGRQVVVMPACPLMHGTGLAGATTSMTFGSRTVLLPSRGLNCDELWAEVERESVYAIVIVGDPFARPMLTALRNGPPRDVSSVRYMHSAGAMFSAEIKQGLLEYMPDLLIVDHIAASEGAMGVSITSRDAGAPTGKFRPHPGVRVINEQAHDVEPGSGEMGLVAIPGAIPLGYFRDETKTAATFREIDGVRHSIPGDWATVGTDGTITLLGRGSQCINTGGEKVFPEEVEEAVKLHPAIEDCLVFGIPDERFGQRVVAVASTVSEVDATEVIADATARLAPYKVPRSIVFVDEVPRAANGKADYIGARDLYDSAAPG